jgi:predicted aspartyl protease
VGRSVTCLAVLCVLAPSLLLSKHAAASTSSSTASSSAAQPNPAIEPALSDPDSEGPAFAVPTSRDRIGRIIAPVMVNGLGPFHFMFDTGATRTILASSMLVKLGLLPDMQTRITVQGVTASALVATVELNTVDAGDLHFRNLTVPVLTGPVLSGIDGILGMDGLAGMKLSADFVHDRITIAKSRGSRAPFVFSVIPIELLSENLLVAEGHVGRVRVKAIIDTGGPQTLGNDALLDALTGRDGAKDRLLPVPVVDATDTARRGLRYRVPDVRLGAASIDNLVITFGDFSVFKAWGLDKEPAILIGMDVLGTLANFTVDYRRREVQLLVRPPELLSMPGDYGCPQRAAAPNCRRSHPLTDRLAG